MVRPALLLALAVVAQPAAAVMAGKTPDTPAARVDANSAASPWASAGSVVVNGSAYSGVAIDRHWVLTAAHVVGSAGPSAVQFVVNGGEGPATLAAAEVHVFPGASFPYDDLALIRLQSPLADTIPIHPVITAAPSQGSVLTFVGYGASGNGDVGVSTGANRNVKRTGSNALDVVTTSVDNSGRTSFFYLYDFDGPTGNGVMGGKTLGNDVETLVAGGDSGSPVFLESGGATWLAGINTFVSSPVGGAITYTFGHLGGGMLLADPRFLAWIQETTAATAATAEAADVPLPWWSLAALLVTLGVPVVRRGGSHVPG